VEHDFLLIGQFFPRQYHSTNAPHSYLIHRSLSKMLLFLSLDQIRLWLLSNEISRGFVIINDKYKKEKNVEEQFLSSTKQRGTRHIYPLCPRKATGQNVNILLAHIIYEILQTPSIQLFSNDTFLYTVILTNPYKVVIMRNIITLIGIPRSRLNKSWVSLRNTECKDPNILREANAQNAL
jgi:hypothetical protein